MLRMRNYELLTIINSEISDEDIEDKIEKIKQLITKEGGEIKDLNKWGKRRLAYEVNKAKKGFYLLIQFSLNPQLVKEVERDLKYVDGIERFMTVSISEGMASTDLRSDDDRKEEAVL